jgi:hypothetical protein
VNLTSLASLTMQVPPVRLITEPAAAPVVSQPWPVGYTMTVWGVAIGVTVLIALIVTTWLRLSPHARALTLQAVVWRLSPGQLLALRSVARVSGIPASVLLVSRGAFESAMTAWAVAEGGELVTPRKRGCLASLSTRVFGHPAV